MMNKKPTQTSRIIRHLREVGYITPLEALSEYGIMRLAARINEIKEEGVIEIRTVTVNTKNRFGESTHFTLYYLKDICQCSSCGKYAKIALWSKCIHCGNTAEINYNRSAYKAATKWITAKGMML